MFPVKMLVHEEVERLTSAMASSLKKKCPEEDIAERALIEGIKTNLVKQYMNNAESSLGMLKVSRPRETKGDVEVELKHFQVLKHIHPFFLMVQTFLFQS